MEDIKRIVLKDKKEFHLDDEDDRLLISIIYDGKALSEFPITYPSNGYGGGTLYLSPSEKYLLFAYYSGQSEEAFTLFKISDRLESVYESDYMGGEAASYGFSKDEKVLIQGLPYMCSDWWQFWEDGQTEKDENGKLFFDFGYINILDVERKILSKHIIRIYPSDNWQPAAESYSPFISPEMVNDNTLKISMPWGDEMLHLPLNDLIVFTQKDEIIW